MPKRNIGPFPALETVGAVDVLTAAPEAIAAAMHKVHQALFDAGCKCNGAAVEAPRDEDWGADISELVARTHPHEITYLDEAGTEIVELVSIKLATLRVEIDSNNEVCAWIYTED